MSAFVVLGLHVGLVLDLRVAAQLVAEVVGRVDRDRVHLGDLAAPVGELGEAHVAGLELRLHRAEAAVPARDDPALAEHPGAQAALGGLEQGAHEAGHRALLQVGVHAHLGERDAHHRVDADVARERRGDLLLER